MLRRKQLTTGDFLKESLPAVLILLHLTVGPTVEVVFYFNSSCRHHIPELILKAAFQSLFGKTTSPVETLFSTHKSSWKSLDLSNLSCPPTTACYRSSVDSILEFLDDRLLSDNLQHLTRGDYKELLELSKVCLGGTIMDGFSGGVWGGSNPPRVG